MNLLSPQLEAFVAVAKNKTVHAAADVLHLTQTAVTQRIRSLEKKLTTTLFSRSRRGMMLTVEGEALLRYCYAATELEGETLAAIKGAAILTEIRLNITGPTSIMRSRILPQCMQVMRQFTNLLMNFNVTDLSIGDRLLKSGESEFAIIPPESVANEMQSKELAPEQYVLVCTNAWRDRDLIDIIKNERIIDFEPKDQQTFNYLKHFDLFKYAKLERHFINRTEGMASMLSAGIGYGVLSKEFSQPFIDRAELIILNDAKEYENEMVLAWYPRPEPPPYFTAIINIIN